MFTKENYDYLHSIVFRGDFPGYRPEVKELPNGDGKVDADKRYAHVAKKYLAKFDSVNAKLLEREILWSAHTMAVQVAAAIGVPETFLPSFEYSCLRILEYPVGASSNEHTDFDLFTLMLYRDQPDKFVCDEPELMVMEAWRCRRAREISPMFHMGEIGAVLRLAPANKHSVLPSDTPQHSIVYFAIPDHDAVLPTGETVGDWIAERMSRSRSYS